MENKHFFYTLTQKWSMKSFVTTFCLLMFLLLGFFMLEGYSDEPIKYEPVSARDPFIPLIGPDGQFNFGDVSESIASNFSIEGIIYDPKGQSVVIIGGEVYNAGDVVQQSTILSILKDRVLFIENDEEKTVWLREEIIS